MPFNKKRFEGLLRLAQYRSARSSGKGGQHVNTTASKAELRIPVIGSNIFSAREENRLQEKLKNRINDQGELIIQQEATRSYHKNKELAEERAFELLQQALYIPKRRKPTKPSKAARLRRLEKKKQHAEKKSRRRWSP